MTTETGGPGQPALWPLLTTARSRLSFRFSATGRTAAALVADGCGSLRAEFWELAPGLPPGCRTVPGFAIPGRDAEPGAVPYDAVPFDDGSLLVIAPDGLRHLSSDGTARPAGRLPARPVHLAPLPDGSAGVLFLTRGDDPALWLWQGTQGTRPRRLAALPPLLARGGGWLDPAGERYLVNLRDAREGGRIVPTVCHLSRGTWRPLPLDPAIPAMAWHTAPRTGEVLLATEGPSGPRLALHGPTGTRAVRWSGQGGQGGKGVVTPMAMHADGRLVALHVTDGADGPGQRLYALDTSADEARPLPAPESWAPGAAAWGASPSGAPRLWSLSIGPGLPARMVAHGPHGWFEVHDGTPAGRATAWAPSRLTPLPGAEGEIEAVVCGHEDWRTARRVAICLHGGPADRWSLKFSQLFQVLAEQELTVIAPNPRGSTGYGEAFHRLITGRWAGPDLDDILALARHVSAARGGEPVALHGASYGAFLALLAAAIAPTLWSRVLAVAPMLSGDRLYPEASAEVRAMIDRLGGRTLLDDAHGPRDVLRQLPRVTAPLAIVHGKCDPVIPASQSRRLVAELERLGRRSRIDFHHVEVPGAGHAPLDGSAELHLAAARFLAHGEWALPPPTALHHREEVNTP